MSELRGHSSGVIVVIAVLGVVGPRLLIKAAKLGLLLAVPAVMYLLHLY